MGREVGKPGGSIAQRFFSRRPCIHEQEGRIEMPKCCIHHYECRHCSFDQWLAEMDGYTNPLDLLFSGSAVSAKAA
jgi:hypothetical protein